MINIASGKNQLYNVDTEKVGLISDYKKTCYLLEYSPDWQLVHKWKLYGCWVSNLVEGEYSYTGNNKREITATIVFDKAKIDRSDEI